MTGSGPSPPVPAKTRRPLRRRLQARAMRAVNVPMRFVAFAPAIRHAAELGG